MDKRYILYIILLLGTALRSVAQVDTLRTHSLDEVVVTGARHETDVRHLPMTVSVVSRQHIENHHTPSLLPILNSQVPGMFVTSRGMMGYGISDGAAGNISLRGLSGGSSRMMVLIDGHPQYMGLMGHPVGDAFQGMMTERVEVLRGPSSVLYGANAMGGVINIVTRKIQEDGVRTMLHAGAGSYGTVQTELTNQVRKGRFTSTVSASYNHTDGHRSDMRFDQYGGYAKLGYELTNRWKVAMDFNLMQFKASQPGTLDAPLLDADQRITRGMTSVMLENRYENTSGSLGFFYNWGRHKINDGYNAAAGETPLDYRFHSTDRMMGLSWFQTMKLLEGNRLTLGFDWYRFGGEAWNLYLDGRRQDIVDKQQDEVAGYVDVRQQVAPWMTINAGLRVDNHSQAGTEWVPQFGAALHLPRRAEVKLTASRGFRPPVIREMFMWGIANPELKAESIWNYEVALSQKLMNGRWTYGINLFYLKGDNLIAVVPVDGRMMNVNTGQVLNKGVEIQTALQVSSAMSVEANYSYLHMKYPVVGAPCNKLYGGLNWTKGKWNLVSGVQYVSGLYKSEKQDEKENFVLLDIRIDYSLNQHVGLWATGENLLAQKYEVMSGYPMPRATVTGGLKLSF